MCLPWSRPLLSPGIAGSKLPLWPVSVPLHQPTHSPGPETQRYSLGQPVSHLAEEPHGPFPSDIWEFGISERCLNDPSCFLVHCRWKKRAKIPNCNLLAAKSGPRPGLKHCGRVLSKAFPLDYGSPKSSFRLSLKKK